MTKQMTEYQFENSLNDTEPTWYENQVNQLSIETCTVWAIHLHLYEQEKDKVLRAFSEVDATTGEFAFGDSWKEWGETAHDGSDLHFVAYYVAHHREQGEEVGTALAAIAAHDLGRMVMFCVSTSGDYAEQIIDGVAAADGTVYGERRR